MTLSHFERRLLDLILEGKDRYEIATALAVRPETVRVAIMALGKKRQASNKGDQ